MPYICAYIPLLGILAGCLPAPLQAEQWNKHYDVGTRPELHVRAGDTAVVLEGWDGSGIDARLEARGWSIGREGVQVIDHSGSNTVDLEVKVPSLRIGIDNRSLRLVVRLPRETTSDVRTSDGSIQLTGLHGSTRVETGDGSVRGDNLAGDVSARSGDGSVHLGGSFQDLQVHTKDGAVELTVASGSKLRTSWRVETGDGSVHVRMPKDLAADLELRTGDGHIRLDGPIARENGDRKEHEVRARLAGGGLPFVVRTGDGSITISAN